MINVGECLGPLSEGFMLGTVVCRYMLAGSGHPPDVVDTINQQCLRKYLTKLVEGDLIIQDQILSGREFDPERESEFQEVASYLLEVLDQVDQGDGDEHVR